MSSKQCSIVEELLVDFADGELAADERRRVSDHLAVCPACQAELWRLERSLQLVQTVWRQIALPLDEETAPASLARSPITNLPQARRFRPRRRLAVAVWMAACILSLLAASSAWWLTRPKPAGRPRDAIAHQETKPPQTLNETDIDDFISRQTRAARLAVAVQILASQPGLESYRAKEEQYLASVSTGTGERP